MSKVEQLLCCGSPQHCVGGDGALLYRSSPRGHSGEVSAAFWDKGGGEGFQVMWSVNKIKV